MKMKILSIKIVSCILVISFLVFPFIFDLNYNIDFLSYLLNLTFFSTIPFIFWILLLIENKKIINKKKSFFYFYFVYLKKTSLYANNEIKLYEKYVETFHIIYNTFVFLILTLLLIIIYNIRTIVYIFYSYIKI